ncbi:hypothetical protein OBBRIDRAFT_727996, partial [Obba rivulosa]
TGSPTLHKFVVYAPDKTDPDTPGHREAFKEAHMKAACDYINNGVFKLGGALLSDDSFGSPNAKQVMVGSLIVIEAESLQAVKDIVTKDPFYTSGKWDLEKLAIHPFWCAIGLQ